MLLKLNIANPTTGQQKVIQIEEEIKIMPFIEKRMGAEIDASVLGEEWKGYFIKIAGGNDKQGFPMMQGVLRPGRVRILFKNGMPCYRERRNGIRKRKSVRGCIVGHDLAIMNLLVVKKGDADIEGLTDTKAESCNKTLGPKRASKIRKLFNLEKDDDVTKYVIRKKLAANDKHKARSKAPKVQRLITPVRVQRKRAQKAAAKQRAHNAKEADAAFRKIMAQRSKMLRAKKDSERSRRISQASSN
jgi:small subunit ribosomal protein S6e